MFESPATLLYRLQTVDQAIAQRRIRLKEINAAMGQNEAVQQAQRQVDAATEDVKPWQGRARDLDLEMKTVLAKIKAAEDNLYSGQVTDPKDMQELQIEIAALKRYESKLEDSLLEAMMYSEEGQSSIDTAQKSLSEMQVLHEGSKVGLLAEKERLESEISQLAVKRGEATVGIEPGMLATYDALRPKKGGNAVALLDDTSCTACRVEQTSNLVRKAQQEKTLVYCATCGRILAPKA
jgi:uncharacterized protein